MQLTFKAYRWKSNYNLASQIQLTFKANSSGDKSLPKSPSDELSLSWSGFETSLSGFAASSEVGLSSFISRWTSFMDTAIWVMARPIAVTFVPGVFLRAEHASQTVPTIWGIESLCALLLFPAYFKKQKTLMPMPWVQIQKLKHKCSIALSYHEIGPTNLTSKSFIQENLMADLTLIEYKVLCLATWINKRALSIKRKIESAIPSPLQTSATKRVVSRHILICQSPLQHGYWM